MTIVKIAETKRLTPEPFKTATATIAVKLLFQSAQIPSAVADLKVDKVERKCYRSGVWVLVMADHKTAYTGPTLLTLKDDRFKRLQPTQAMSGEVTLILVIRPDDRPIAALLQIFITNIPPGKIGTTKPLWYA